MDKPPRFFRTRRIVTAGVGVVIASSLVSGMALAGPHARPHDVAANHGAALSQSGHYRPPGLQTRHNEVVTLDTVPAADLAANGETLTTPSTTTPPVSAKQAQGVALTQAAGAEGATVLEQVLANLTNTAMPGMTNRLVWAFSVMPVGGMPPPSCNPSAPCDTSAHYTYMVVFVDATTGAFLYAEQGSAPVASSSTPSKTRR